MPDKCIFSNKGLNNQGKNKREITQRIAEELDQILQLPLDHKGQRNEVCAVPIVLLQTLAG